MEAPLHKSPDPFLSQKMRFWSFVSMLVLVYVHGYNLHDNYLQPFTLTGEPLTFTGFFEYWVSNGVVRFRIPMLLAISGYLYALGDAAPAGRRLLKRLRTVGLPYLLWGQIALLVTLIFEYSSERTCDAVMDSWLAGKLMLLDMPLEQFVQWFFFPMAFQLWFLRALLVCNAIYPFLRMGVQRMPRQKEGASAVQVTGAILAKVFISITFVAWLLHFELPFYTPEAICSFTLGVWLAKRGGIPDAPPWGTKAWHWMAASLVMATGKTYLAFYWPDYQHFGYPQGLTMLFLHKGMEVTALIGAWYGLDSLVRRCMGNKAFVWLSAFSFYIYALHEPLLHYLTQYVFRFVWMYQYHRIVVFLLLPISTAAFCVLVGWLTRSLAPGLYGILTGGRGLPKKEVKQVAVA